MTERYDEEATIADLLGWIGFARGGRAEERLRSALRAAHQAGQEEMRERAHAVAARVVTSGDAPWDSAVKVAKAIRALPVGQGEGESNPPGSSEGSPT